MSIAHEKNHVLSGTFVISTTELQNQSLLLLLLNGSIDDGFSVAIHVARAIYCCKRYQDQVRTNGNICFV